eukprot:143857-Amphidinium_carterae.2
MDYIMLSARLDRQASCVRVACVQRSWHHMWHSVLQLAKFFSWCVGPPGLANIAKCWPHAREWPIWHLLTSVCFAQ